MEEQLRQIISQAIDLHVHIGPEIIPRKFTVDKLIRSEEGSLAGMALKNHFFPTLPLIKSSSLETTLNLVGAVTLNNAVGGINPEAIYATSTLSGGKPFIVWLPTTNAKQFLCSCEYEIAPEWIAAGSKVKIRKSNSIPSLSVIDDNNQLTKAAKDVCQAIKEASAILATGHLSWQECLTLTTYATSIGINKIIITHPIYQKIAMPIVMQRQLASKGCFIEHCYSMHSIDKIPSNNIASQIKKVGAKFCVLSSDVGQSYSPTPSQALFEFAKLLIREGISLSELKTMLITNPKKLLNIN